MKMLSIQEIVEAFEKKGFKVHKFWNQCKPSDQGYYEFTIIKDNTYVGGIYEWRPELSPDVIALYQRNFIDELLERWKKEHDRYCLKMLEKGLAEGSTNPDPELKQYAKQILNSIYGKNAFKEIYISTSRPLPHNYIEKFVNYCEEDVKNTKEPWPKMNPYTNKSTTNPQIKDVIFNEPATIVFWSDSTKTVVKCQEDDIYDPEKGLAMAISKKVLGNGYDYYNIVKKYLKKYEKQAFNPSLEVTPSKRMPVDYVSNDTPVTTDGPKTIKMLATMEIEVDIGESTNPQYSNVVDMAKDIARNKLRDFMLNKDINADSFNYEFVIPNKAEVNNENT